MKWGVPRSWAGAALLLFGAGCTPSTTSTSTGDLFLGAVADRIALPTLEALADSSGTLADAAARACQGPGPEGLAAVEAAWRDNRNPLKRSEAFSFGPADTLRLEADLDFWPARPEDVEALLAGTSTLSAQTLAELGATHRGSSAIEVLLFDPLGDRASAWAHLTANGGRGCRYLVAASAVYAADAQRLLEAWAPKGGAFRDQLAAPGQGRLAFFADSRAAVSAVVNQQIATLGTLESKKLAKPLGRQDGGTPQPQALESRPSGNSTADLLATLLGVQQVYEAQPEGGPSLKAFVAERSPEVEAELSETSRALERALLNFDRPLERMIAERPDEVTAAFTLAQSLHRQWAGPVAGLLGVTVNFSDADGD